MKMNLYSWLGKIQQSFKSLQGYVNTSSTPRLSQSHQKSEPSSRPPIKPSGKVVYEKISDYHNIYITEDYENRYLRFDTSWQSGMSLRDPEKASFVYTDYFQLAWIFHPKIQSVLFLGLGGGSSPKKFYTDFPEVSITAVEIDPVVVEVAEQYFHIPKDERLLVVIDDGRNYLEKTEKLYDLIVLDAFIDQTVPPHLTTKECFQVIFKHLGSEGVFAFNIIGDLSGRYSHSLRSVYKTFSSVFPQTYLFETERERNVIFIGTASADRLSRQEIVTRAGRLKEEKVKVALLENYASRLYEYPIDTNDVLLLTDEQL
jgi:spermidine synthase